MKIAKHNLLVKLKQFSFFLFYKDVHCLLQLYDMLETLSHICNSVWDLAELPPSPNLPHFGNCSYLDNSQQKW